MTKIVYFQFAIQLNCIQIFFNFNDFSKLKENQTRFCKYFHSKILQQYKGIIEFIQGPGETVFVPGGWWHAVINVTDTIAVTQNYMNSVNIPWVWPSFRKERKKLACYALKKYQKKIPQIHQRLVDINEKDGFVMHDKKQSLKKKIFLEDEMKAKQEKRELFNIANANPRYLSSDQTSNSSSSSSSSSYSSSSSSDQHSDSRSRSRSHSRKNRNKSRKRNASSKHQRNNSNSSTTSR
ncbi:hypothetical protein ABPG74_013516 [Tetrahymena malaccensis]